jgi:hypothetical protein
LDVDENLVLVFGLVVSGVFGARWYGRLQRRRRLARIGGPIGALARLLPLVLVASLRYALSVAAATDVRADGSYLLLFTALGGAWLVGAAQVTALLGIHVLDDALDRRNLAAAVAVAGAVVGMLVCYAFANFGEGPTIWTTIAPALLASAGCGLLWLAHQLATDAADAITIGRDLASGLRFAGMTVATGLIVGRAVAGDWESSAATARDLLEQGWPALPLVLVAAWIHKQLEPNRAQPHPNWWTRGVAPAAAYLGVAGVDLFARGSWLPGGGALQ